MTVTIPASIGHSPAPRPAPQTLTLAEWTALAARAHQAHREKRALVLHPHLALRLIEAAHEKFGHDCADPQAG